VKARQLPRPNRLRPEPVPSNAKPAKCRRCGAAIVYVHGRRGIHHVLDLRTAEWKAPDGAPRWATHVRFAEPHIPLCGVEVERRRYVD